jgi:ribosomal protein S18 acetylase RimI-like enzyme
MPVLRSANRADFSAISYLAYLAGKSQMDKSSVDFMFPGSRGPTEERLGFLAALLGTTAVSWFNYLHFHVVEKDTRVAAAACLFDTSGEQLADIETSLAELGWSARDLAGMKKRMEPFSIVDFPRPDDALIVETLACLPEYRRRGFSGLLLDRAVEKAREQGLGRAVLTIYIGNVPAQSAYEKYGFQVIDEKRDAGFERATGCPGKALMSLDIAGTSTGPAREE